ncbi:hypothetical protein GEV33_007035 [Tenebrio molitor]|uniref:Reverse transcriptase RNase H-like domain-containing protein n=1 Tax=Tenebrio molitor TaxID=7067 RepID=A0A8J6HKL6_TENMO|nr:hypothetical protein GEV33_007035 [Tenebrio molitor]
MIATKSPSLCPPTERRHGHPNVPAVDDSTWTGTWTDDDAGCRWCNTGLLLRMPTSCALNGFYALNVNPMIPRRSPTVSVSISGVEESAIVDTVACYSVASAGLDKHLLATGHPTQKVIVKATLADNDARENGPLPPTSVITHPAVPDGRTVWSAYQAHGSSDYIMQDAADALMDYEMESSSGYDSPIRIHLATLHLRPVEGASLPENEKQRLNALLDQYAELFAKTEPPTPFAQYRIDTGDSTLIASPPYRLTPANPIQPFILRTDGSAYALGTALLQGEAPEECPIEYASRLLTKTERNCSTREREVLANVWTINKFRSYVKETSIVVIIDCRLLPWFIALKPPPDFYNSTKAGRKLERPMKRNKIAVSSTPAYSPVPARCSGVRQPPSLSIAAHGFKRSHKPCPSRPRQTSRAPWYLPRLANHPVSRICGRRAQTDPPHQEARQTPKESGPIIRPILLDLRGRM